MSNDEMMQSLLASFNDPEHARRYGARALWLSRYGAFALASGADPEQVEKIVCDGGRPCSAAGPRTGRGDSARSWFLRCWHVLRWIHLARLGRLCLKCLGRLAAAIAGSDILRLGEQGGRFGLQNVCGTSKHVIDAALKRVDIGAVDVSAVGKVLLR